MKKFVTTILLSIFAAVGIFGFAACDGEEKPVTDNDTEQNQPEKDDTEQNKPEEDDTEQDGAYVRVSEEQFNEAVGMFVLDADNYFEKYGEKLNFTMRGMRIEGDNEMELIGKFDYADKKFSAYSANMDLTQYCWQDETITYAYGLDGGTTTKESQNTFEEEFLSGLVVVTVTVFVGAGDNPYQYLTEKGLTFDEQTGLYKTTMEMFGSDMNIELGISGGKLVYLNCADQQNQAQYYYSDYGTTGIIIPDEILNMPVEN